MPVPIECWQKLAFVNIVVDNLLLNPSHTHNARQITFWFTVRKHHDRILHQNGPTDHMQHQTIFVRYSMTTVIQTDLWSIVIYYRRNQTADRNTHKIERVCEQTVQVWQRRCDETSTSQHKELFYARRRPMLFPTLEKVKIVGGGECKNVLWRMPGRVKYLLVEV